MFNTNSNDNYSTNNDRLLGLHASISELHMPYNWDCYNYRCRYRQYIEDKVTSEAKSEFAELMVLSEGWIKCRYVYAIDGGTCLYLLIGNEVQGISIVSLPLKIKLSRLNGEDNKYLRFDMNDLRAVLSDIIVKELLARGLIGFGINTDTTTTLQRLIWTIGFNDDIHGLQVHHIDGNTRNNSLTNLIPLDITDHSKFHVDYREHRIDDTGYINRINNYRKPLRPVRQIYSRYDDLHYKICHYYYILNYQPEDMLNSKIFNSNKPPCETTIWNIVRLYPDYNSYYEDVVIISRKICTSGYSSGSLNIA